MGRIKSNKSITISSLQEQEEGMRRYWASITPEERLIHLYEMIHYSYLSTNEQVHHSSRINTIKIETPGEHFS